MMVYCVIMDLFGILLQITPPFDSATFELWKGIIGNILNIFFILSIKGYLILLLLGFMVYATTLSDGMAKSLIVGALFFYFVGPLILNLIATSTGMTLMSIDDAAIMWIQTFGMTEAELVFLLLTIGDFIAAVTILTGAIMYFNPSSGDLKSKGHSLIIRGIIFLPVLAFVYIIPWI